MASVKFLGDPFPPLNEAGEGGFYGIWLSVLEGIQIVQDERSSY